MAKSISFDRWGNLLIVAFIIVLPLLIIPVLSARADCTDPPAVEGDQLYNADHKTMQFCDGAQWWSMKGNEVSLPVCAEGDGVVMSSSGWACSPGGPP